MSGIEAWETACGWRLKSGGQTASRCCRAGLWLGTTQEVDGWIFDDTARTFVLDDGMRRFFEEDNLYTLEEI